MPALGYPWQAGVDPHLGDRATWVLYVACRTLTGWTAAKRRLGFCTITRDGDAEGCLRLHRLPTLEQAVVIRDVIGIQKRREISESERKRLKAFAFASSFALREGIRCNNREEQQGDYRLKWQMEFS